MSDDLKADTIEQAARTMRNRWSMQTPPTDDDYANARALSRDGLLVDPSAKAERDAALAEVDRLNLEIQGYQTSDGYDKGWEHGSAGARAWKRERDEFRAERDALQARIDAALALVSDHHSMEVTRVGILALRAVLLGDSTPTEENP